MEQSAELNDKLVNGLIERKILKTKAIIEAFRNIPRYKFVTENMLDFANEDIALPLMKGSTISQPTTIAIILEVLQPKMGDEILEIGTGSGWQAALLGYLVGAHGKVTSLEIENKMAAFARTNLKKTNIGNVKVHEEDGTMGYQKDAPYDKIIFSAAMKDVPKKVMDELKVGGMLLAPIGDVTAQELTLIERYGPKQFDEKGIGYFQFLPLRKKERFPY